jgi:mRNA degradation ribonuclease J1/J2
MEEDSCGFDLVVRDSRSLRGGNPDRKKRLNQKETKERLKQKEKREEQRMSQGKGSEDLKQEYDEINKEYLRAVERKQKEERKAKKMQEKQEMFQKDFMSHAFGPEPKNENQKRDYQEKIQNFTNSKPTKVNHVASVQQSALLNFLQNSFK